MSNLILCVYYCLWLINSGDRYTIKLFPNSQFKLVNILSISKSSNSAIFFLLLVMAKAIALWLF
ncbi:hypothetical protein [Pleurocapsa sp. FMAR1]|uniref:hypothetical protein n=1 Tax=Pleurocapsa sp. FMAR1 TaxID=3040204 RepID=UPI0029C8C6DF|nr:hypothetical protein [Pleurocapsa sp. FMAR1]